MKKIVLLLIFVIIFSGCNKKDTDSPRVISTNPLNGSIDVDPSLSEISVAFNEEMMDKGWSWCMENKDTFPQIIGSPYYVDGYTKNIAPVKLLPDKEYVIWINTSSITNFKDKSGNSAVPFKFTFKTKSIDSNR